MSEIKWEYCLLQRFRYNPDERRSGEEQIIANYIVQFFGSNGHLIKQPIHQVTTKNAQDPDKEFPFGQLMGVIGGAGWELVSIYETIDRVDIATNTSAYFKRPVREGRAPNEPHMQF